MDVTRELISRILELRNIPVIPNWFQPCAPLLLSVLSGEHLRLGNLSGAKRKKGKKVLFLKGFVRSRILYELSGRRNLNEAHSMNM